jgi:hypothetical protein
MNYTKFCNACRKRTVWVGLRCAECEGIHTANETIESLKSETRKQGREKDQPMTDNLRKLAERADNMSPNTPNLLRHVDDQNLKEFARLLIEVCAAQVPTSWLDPLLCGPETDSLPLEMAGVERLLIRLRQRISALSAKGESDEG